MILILTTRNDLKRREVTCSYAKGVDGVNSAGAQIFMANGAWPPEIIECVTPIGRVF
jgi:hypothetical protein